MADTAYINVDPEVRRAILRTLRRHRVNETTPSIEELRIAHACGVRVAMKGGKVKEFEATEAEREAVAAEVSEEQQDPTLEDLTVSELRALAGDLEIPGRSSMAKPELIAAIRER